MNTLFERNCPICDSTNLNQVVVSKNDTPLTVTIGCEDCGFALTLGSLTNPVNHLEDITLNTWERL